ncbi:hypothetical protein ACNFHO_27285, partial [Pseudomonas sp. NY15374]
MPTENRSTMVSLPRDEVERLVKLLAYQAHPYPSPHAEYWQGILDAPGQHQVEPVGMLLIDEYFDSREVGDVDVQLDSKVCEQLAANYPGQSLPIYTHPAPADPGEVERLRAALKFYADRDHFAEDIGNEWDSVSGEPANILWHEH